MDDASSPRDRERNGSVCVLEPGPYLEGTVEPGAHDDAELHLHPAGQGFWIARIAARLGAEVMLVAPFGGETGRVLKHLVPLEGMRTATVVTEGANGSVVHDRRAHDNEQISVPGPQLVRHDRDDLHGAAFSSALNADVFVLAGSRTQLLDTSTSPTTSAAMGSRSLPTCPATRWPPHCPAGSTCSRSAATSGARTATCRARTATRPPRDRGRASGGGGQRRRVTQPRSQHRRHRRRPVGASWTRRRTRRQPWWR